MVKTAVELVERMTECSNRGDIDGMLAFCDPHVVTRLDPGLRVIEGVPFGADALRGYLAEFHDTMGLGQLTVLSKEDFGAWGILRFRQEIHNPTGVEAEWLWTMIATARDGAIVMIEFFLDDDAARSAAGLN